MASVGYSHTIIFLQLYLGTLNTPKERMAYILWHAPELGLVSGVISIYSVVAQTRLYFHNLPSPNLTSGKSITVIMQKQASKPLMITNGISHNHIFSAKNNRTPSTYLDCSAHHNRSGHVE